MHASTYRKSRLLPRLDPFFDLPSTLVQKVEMMANPAHAPSH